MMTSKSSTSIYTTKRVTDWGLAWDGALCQFLREEAPKLTVMFGFNWQEFSPVEYAKENIFWVCRRREEPVGILLARLSGSIFEPSRKILFQDLLYVKEGGGRAAWHLLREFIDFGVANADHVFTMTTPNSNLKGSSLEKLGFKKSEELYELEVK